MLSNHRKLVNFQCDFLRSFEFAYSRKQLSADYVMNAWYWKKSSETALLPNYFSLILIYKSREKTKISTQIYGKNRVNNDKYRNSLLTIVFDKKKIYIYILKKNLKNELSLINQPRAGQWRRIMWLTDYSWGIWTLHCAKRHARWAGMKKGVER